MGMLLVRISLGVGVVVLAVQWPTPVLLGVWVLIIWLVPRAGRDYREIRQLRGLVGPAVERVKELETDLVLIRETNVALLAEIEQLQAHGSNRPNGRAPGLPLYRKVGLHPIVVQALQSPSEYGEHFGFVEKGAAVEAHTPVPAHHKRCRPFL